MLSQPKSKLWMVFTLLIVTNMILTACGAAVPATPAAANTAMPIPPTYTSIPLEQATAAPTTPPRRGLRLQVAWASGTGPRRTRERR